ncbi:MAG TPA: cytochrome B [Aliiroseovarius sp.]|nr:cytochrome B [Aliiroseovarius sp.]
MERKKYVWDPLVRLFHWSLVVLFVTLALILDPESALHVKLGYVVAGLIAFRVVWGLIGTRHARFTDFPPSPRAAMEQLGDIATGRKRLHLGHTPLGALMIYNLLLTIGLIALTGWMMGTMRFFGVEWVEEVHEALVGWAGISVIAHIAAVVYESRRVGINLPKAMVTGYKAIPQEE